MTARAQAMNLMELVPDMDMPILLEVIRHFIPTEDADDIATPDDILACEEAMREYRTGETISHNDIDWS